MDAGGSTTQPGEALVSREEAAGQIRTALHSVKAARRKGKDVRGLARVLLKARAAYLRQDYRSAAIRAETVLLLCEASDLPPLESPEQRQETRPQQSDAAAPPSRATSPSPVMWQRPSLDPPPKKKARAAPVIASIVIAIAIVGGVFAWAPDRPSDSSSSAPPPPSPPSTPPPPTQRPGLTGFWILAGGDDTNCWSGAFANVGGSSSLEGCGDRQITWSCDRGFDVLSGVVQKQDGWDWTLTLNVLVRGTVRESASTGASYGVASATAECP
jgi:hypothetical protein